jgi:taurine dioxygenase
MSTSSRQVANLSAQRIHVMPLTPTIGAEINNVDLAQQIAEETFRQIHAALIDHCVIFFRDQKLAPENVRDLAARFGVLNTDGFLPQMDGLPEVTILQNDEERPPAINFWHTDSTYMQAPVMGVVLYAEHVPSFGGDTIWANMYAAYDALSDHMKRLLSGLSAVHSVSYAAYVKALGDKVKVDKRGGDERSAEHPVVRTHPVTKRKCLFVNKATTKYIKGLHTNESDAILQMLYRHVELPEFHIRFRWRPHSIAIWDNRCTQHYAVADYYPQRRLMHRVPIAGDVPH